MKDEIFWGLNNIRYKWLVYKFLISLLITRVNQSILKTNLHVAGLLSLANLNNEGDYELTSLSG